MSNPNPKPKNKRSSPLTTTSNGGASTTSMKKAKSQANSSPPLQDDNNATKASSASTVYEDLSIYNPNKAVMGVNSGSSSSRSSHAASNLHRKKTLVIRWISAIPTLPENFEENTWATLKSGINAIFLKQSDPRDLQGLYEGVFELCLHKMGGRLYQRIEEECETHISAALQSLVGCTEDLVVFLSLIEKCWLEFCDQMLIIRAIAVYLDKTYVKETPNLRSLRDMGLQLFRKHLSLASEVEHKTVSNILQMIKNERLGEAVDRTRLKHLLKMFTDLGIYSERFEKKFLEATSEFYAAEGIKYMQQLDVPDYLKHVERTLHEEHQRCLDYLDASTRKPLVATAESQLLKRHVLAILDKGFAMLMDGKCIEDLQRMYTLLSRVDALESLKQAFSSYIRRTEQSIVMEEEKDKDMLLFRLSHFEASMYTIWEECFSKNEAYSNTIQVSLGHLINIRQIV